MFNQFYTQFWEKNVQVDDLCKASHQSKQNEKTEKKKINKIRT